MTYKLSARRFEFENPLYVLERGRHRVATAQGYKMHYAEYPVSDLLERAGLKWGLYDLPPGTSVRLTDALGRRFTLLLRVIAPMRHRWRIENAARRVAALSDEAVRYYLNAIEGDDDRARERILRALRA